ncbi:MAG TPA: hypothetical protein VEJ84_24680, partial [Acidimicrobiales bacterium]|nr:hypothetical protein [Acidimicrobiales bacterium]
MRALVSPRVEQTRTIFRSNVVVSVMSWSQLAALSLKIGVVAEGLHQRAFPFARRQGAGQLYCSTRRLARRAQVASQAVGAARQQFHVLRAGSPPVGRGRLAVGGVARPARVVVALPDHVVVHAAGLIHIGSPSIKQRQPGLTRFMTTKCPLGAATVTASSPPLTSSVRDRGYRTTPQSC